MEWLKTLGNIYKTDKNDYFINTNHKNIPHALQILKDNNITHISSITGIDTRKDIEIIYHFSEGKNTINLKIHINRDTPETTTITKEFPGALLFEKELAEMLGIKIKGIKNEHLILSDKSPVYPLRRD
ncbi:MAG: NADH-quinone oxidoreductase subunit C [DPANN group archaeon]|nr:NADH-quinone oxidoreductase subunit C [DPANN group archaeon]